MENSINFMAIVEILIAGYLFYAAIRGKSRIFVSAYVKEGKEAKYKKTGRIGVFVIATLVLILGVFNLLVSITNLNNPLTEAQLSDYSTISNVLMVITLTALLGVYLTFFFMQDRKKKRQLPRSTAPRAAFYFDEEEAAAPPPKQQQKKKKGK